MDSKIRLDQRCRNKFKSFRLVANRKRRRSKHKIKNSNWKEDCMNTCLKEDQNKRKLEFKKMASKSK